MTLQELYLTFLAGIGIYLLYAFIGVPIGLVIEIEKQFHLLGRFKTWAEMNPLPKAAVKILLALMLLYPTVGMGLYITSQGGSLLWLFGGGAIGLALTFLAREIYTRIPYVLPPDEFPEAAPRHGEAGFADDATLRQTGINEER